jgi:hypothetical protein
MTDAKRNKKRDFEQAKRSDSGHETSPSSFSKLAWIALVEVVVPVFTLSSSRRSVLMSKPAGFLQSGRLFVRAIS